MFPPMHYSRPWGGGSLLLSSAYFTVDPLSVVQGLHNPTLYRIAGGDPSIDIGSETCHERVWKYVAVWRGEGISR